jgi:hypothetical protein
MGDIKYVGIKSLRAGKPYGREYTYRTIMDLHEGDEVMAPMGKTNAEKLCVVTTEDVPEESIGIDLDLIKYIKAQATHGDVQQDVAPEITLPDVPTAEFSNTDVIEDALVESLTKYKRIIVTDETLQDCKKAATDLNAWKKTIDEKRKEVHSVYKNALNPFDEVCKRWTGMIDEVRGEITSQTKKFDEKRKHAKAVIAAGLIDQAIAEFELKEAYAIQLTMKPQYSNITASDTDTKEDVYARATVLKEQQDAAEKEAEEHTLLIQQTIDYDNARTAKKLTLADVQSMIDRHAPITDIISEIHAKSQLIYDAEHKKDEVNEALAKDPIKPHETLKPDHQNAYMDMHVEAPLETLKALNAYMDSVGIKHTTVGQGWA